MRVELHLKEYPVCNLVSVRVCVWCGAVCCVVQICVCSQSNVCSTESLINGDYVWSVETMNSPQREGGGGGLEV